MRPIPGKYGLFCARILKSTCDAVFGNNFFEYVLLHLNIEKQNHYTHNAYVRHIYGGN